MKKVTPEQAVKQLHKELESYLDDCIKVRAPFDYEVVEGYISLICAAAQAK